MKTTSCLLALAIASTPLSIRADDPPTTNVIGIDDCIIILAGGTLILGLYCIWYHGVSSTHDMTNQPPGWPYPPPWEEDPDQGGEGVPMSLKAVKAEDCSNLGYVDTACGLPFTNVISFTLQAGAQPSKMTNRFGVMAWTSPKGRLVLVNAADGSSVWTNYALMGLTGLSTNYCPMLSTRPTRKPSEVFRLLSQ